MIEIKTTCYGKRKLPAYARSLRKPFPYQTLEDK
jgi:hypothetical protein